MWGLQRCAQHLAGHRDGNLRQFDVQQNPRCSVRPGNFCFIALLGLNRTPQAQRDILQDLHSKLRLVLRVKTV